MYTLYKKLILDSSFEKCRLKIAGSDKILKRLEIKKHISAYKINSGYLFDK
jgi:hypothetical protein